MNFLEESCTFYTLTPELIESSNQFDCGHSDLNEFFLKDAESYANQLLGKSYCFIDNNDLKSIVCAFSISNDSIKASLLPRGRKDKVTKQIPHVKTSKNHPAVLIGRLGVSVNYKNQGIGKSLMDFIKSWFIDPQNKTGCRFVVVDAYNENLPIKYYKSCGFDFLFSTEDQEKRYSNIQSSDPLKTRLMFFDLILLKNQL